jgi:predicted ATPase
VPGCSRSTANYLAEAATGRGRLVFVAGEAGAGKNAFVGRLVAEADADVSMPES